MEYEHYQHLFEEEDEEHEIIDYTDFTQLSVSRPEVGSCATSSSVHNEKLLPEPSELPELNREQNADPQGTIERSMDVSVGQETQNQILARVTAHHQLKLCIPRPKQPQPV
ncbi:hypothetical protein ACLB1R_35545 [Escherichia coli]